jgi:hypothetical protein
MSERRRASGFFNGIHSNMRSQDVLSAGLVLLAAEEREQRDTSDLDNLETAAGNITDGVTRATETRNQHFILWKQHQQ